MVISRVTQVSDELIRALASLIPQLTSNSPPPNELEVAELLASKTSNLLVARWPDIDGTIVGLLSLVIYRIPTGVRAHIEDLIVDSNHRSKGISKALMAEALKLAKQSGANGVSLTCHPRREAANRLYRRVGFIHRETNVYFYPFTKSQGVTS